MDSSELLIVCRYKTNGMHWIEFQAPRTPFQKTDADVLLCISVASVATLNTFSLQETKANQFIAKNRQNKTKQKNTKKRKKKKRQTHSGNWVHSFIELL